MTRLRNAWREYRELWQEMPIIGYPWLILSTIIPVTPAMLLIYGNGDT